MPRDAPSVDSTHTKLGLLHPYSYEPDYLTDKCVEWLAQEQPLTPSQQSAKADLKSPGMVNGHLNKPLWADSHDMERFMHAFADIFFCEGLKECVSVEVLHKCNHNRLTVRPKPGFGIPQVRIEIQLHSELQVCPEVCRKVRLQMLLYGLICTMFAIFRCPGLREHGDNLLKALISKRQAV